MEWMGCMYEESNSVRHIVHHQLLPWQLSNGSRERGVLFPGYLFLASVGSDPEPTETRKFTFRRNWTFSGMSHKGFLDKVHFYVVASFNIPWITVTLLLMLFIASFLLQNIAATVAQWQEWGGWSQCTASCGQGSRFRARACSEPEVGGDVLCLGNVTEIEECKTSECSGIINCFIHGDQFWIL